MSTEARMRRREWRAERLARRRWRAYRRAAARLHRARVELVVEAFANDLDGDDGPLAEAST